MCDELFVSARFFNRFRTVRFMSRGKAEVIYGHRNLWAYVAMREGMDYSITRVNDWLSGFLARIRQP